MPEFRLPTGSAARRRWALQSAVLLLVVWIALDGVDALLVGVVFAVLGAALGTWLVPGEPYPWRPLRLLRFALYFLGESLRGGIDVASRALHPRMPIDPCYIDYRCKLPAGLPLTVFTSVIGLLPGTLSVDLLDGGRLRVHALSEPGAMRALEQLEARMRLLFSLDRAPASDAESV